MLGRTGALRLFACAALHCTSQPTPKPCSKPLGKNIAKMKRLKREKRGEKQNFALDRRSLMVAMFQSNWTESNSRATVSTFGQGLHLNKIVLWMKDKISEVQSSFAV